MLGIRTYFKKTADQSIADATLITVGLLSAIAANQTQKFRAWIPVTVGAAGGVRAQVVVPAGGALFIASIKLYNTVAPSLTTAIQTASAAFTNALADAGTHWLEIEGTVVNGATAGSIDIQLAQNTVNATALVVEAGASLEVVAS